MEKELGAKIIALVVVIGFVCFGGGYLIAGGAEKLAGQHLIGENITVYVKAPSESTYTSVELNSGMTVFDAVANIVPIKTEVHPEIQPFSAIVKSIDDQWFMYTVNGETPTVGMGAYQLIGGENIELTLV